MVLLYLNEVKKEKLQLLNQYAASILKEFCRIALDLFQKEINNKIYTSAAQKLNIPTQDLKDLIEIISWIFIQNSKLSLSEDEFKESLALAGLNSDLTEEILESSKANFNQIQNYLKDCKIETTSFKSLEWRVDTKVASRSVKKSVEPEIMLKLNLAKNENETENHIIKADVVNLVNMTNTLEEALNELRTNYCRKVFRKGV